MTTDRRTVGLIERLPRERVFELTDCQGAWYIVRVKPRKGGGLMARLGYGPWLHLWHDVDMRPYDMQSTATNILAGLYRAMDAYRTQVASDYSVIAEVYSQEGLPVTVPDEDRDPDVPF